MLDGTLSDMGPAKTLIVSFQTELLNISSVNYSHLIICHLDVGDEASTENGELHRNHGFENTNLLMLDSLRYKECLFKSLLRWSSPHARVRCELLPPAMTTTGS